MSTKEKQKGTFKQFLIEMFSGEKEISSKRVCGFMGWVVCLFLCVYCSVSGKEASDIVDMLFICSTSLLGLDSITGIWKKSVTKTGGTSKKTYNNSDDEEYGEEFR